MNNFTLTEIAERDLEYLGQVTAERFGFAQVKKNKAEFDRVFGDLASHPLMGHLRDDLSAPSRGLRFITVKRRFIVIYQPRDDGVDIIRVLDGNQDILAALDAV